MRGGLNGSLRKGVGGVEFRTRGVESGFARGDTVGNSGVADVGMVGIGTLKGSMEPDGVIEPVSLSARA